MARSVAQERVLAIVNALADANATEIRGLSSPEIVRATGIGRYSVENILKKPEYGFKFAKGRSETGAATYYHDVTAVSAIIEEQGMLKPLQYDDEDKIIAVIHNLMTALGTLDPGNYYAKMVAAEISKAENKDVLNKDYWYWAFTATLPKEATALLNEAAKNNKVLRGKEIIKDMTTTLKTAGYDLSSARGCLDGADYVEGTWFKDDTRMVARIAKHVMTLHLVVLAAYLSEKEGK